MPWEFLGSCSVFPGSTQHFRGVLKSYGQGNKSYGDVFNFHGTERLIYKFSGTTINLRGIFPHMDRHRREVFRDLIALEPVPESEWGIERFFQSRASGPDCVGYCKEGPMRWGVRMGESKEKVAQKQCLSKTRQPNIVGHQAVPLNCVNNTWFCHRRRYAT